MVEGIEKFREYFVEHEGKYAIIGGTACDLLFDTVGQEFRLTKDIDMVLCVEVVDAEFATAFKDFLNAGGYKARERGSDGKREFFRFHKPDDKTFPYMIELLARKSGLIDFSGDARITPIDVEEYILSLSAIILDEVYFQALQDMKTQVLGVTIIDERILIPFKAKAYLNLRNELESEEASKDKKIEKNIQKHCEDVFGLIPFLSSGINIPIANEIRDDLRRFIALVEKDATLDPKTFGVDLTREEGIDLLRSAYGL